MNKTQEALEMAIEALEIAEQIEGYGLIVFEKYGFKEDADILKKYRQTLQACKEALEVIAKYDNEVIEQCVKIVESFKEADPYTGEIFTSNTNVILNECIEAIKELKGEE